MKSIETVSVLSFVWAYRDLPVINELFRSTKKKKKSPNKKKNKKKIKKQNDKQKFPEWRKIKLLT